MTGVESLRWNYISGVLQHQGRPVQFVQRLKEAKLVQEKAAVLFFYFYIYTESSSPMPTTEKYPQHPN